jgi:hypothetical protein
MLTNEKDYETASFHERYSLFAKASTQHETLAFKFIGPAYLNAVGA